jgi:ribonuclease HI
MIRVFTDGATQPNPGHMGIGVVIEWQGTTPTIISKYIGEGTNNIAEYSALLEALQVIRNEQIMKVQINSDSNLMVNQVNGNWKCKDTNLKKLCDKAQARISWLKENNYEVELVYIPRKFNLADEPAKRGAEEGKMKK